MKQERIILLTNLYLSNIKKKRKDESSEYKFLKIEFQRKIPMSKLKAATKSTIDGNFEFIVHVKKEYDYRFVCEQ
jgi:hypothetical protein